MVAAAVTHAPLVVMVLSMVVERTLPAGMPSDSPNDFGTEARRMRFAELRLDKNPGTASAVGLLAEATGVVGALELIVPMDSCVPAVESRLGRNFEAASLSAGRITTLCSGRELADRDTAKRRSESQSSRHWDPPRR